MTRSTVIPRFCPFFVLAALSGAGAGLALSDQAFAACLLAVGLLLYIFVTFASVRDPILVAGILIVTVEVMPPLYLSSLGDWPVYPFVFLAPALVVVLLFRWPDLQPPSDRVAVGIGAFLTGILFSVPFAYWVSGPDAGVVSGSRWLLLCLAALVYFLIRSGGRHVASLPERSMPVLLFVGAVAAAVYGIVDFVWPIPLNHPPAEQLIWLAGTVVRRAQGPFYESSSFASFCGFFLVAGGAALLGRRERYLGVSREALLGLVGVLGLAVLVSFSRSAWAGILTALLVVLGMGRFVRIPRGFILLLALATPVFLLWALSPELWDYLIDARIGRLFDLLIDPDAATSGRFATWREVVSIMQSEPRYLLFGVGYKTLAETPVFGGEIVTDNGYLSLMLETGIVGLAGFVLLSLGILTTFYRLARSRDDRTAFWATTLLATWCGELVLLLAADAHTYWRNLTVLAALMALTLNMAARSETTRVRH